MDQAAVPASSSGEGVPALTGDVRLRALIEHSADGLVVLDADGVLTYASPATARMTGYTAKERAGRRVLELVHPDDLQSLMEELGALPDTPRATATVEYRLRHKDGSWRRMEAVCTNLLDDPNVQGIVVNLRDITDQRRAEEELRASRDQLAAIFQSVSEGITVQDTSGSLVYANDAAAALCGYPSARALAAAPALEIAGRFELLDEAGHRYPPDRLPGRRVLAGEQLGPVTLRFRVLATGEERWSLIVATPIFDERGQGRLVVSVFHDITDQRQLEAELRQAIQARDQFLSIASHELRTPLTILKAQVELSLRRLERGVATTDLAQSLVVVRRQADRLNRLVGDLLDVSRLARGQFVIAAEPVELGPLVAGVVAGQRALDPDRVIEVVFAGQGLVVRGDADRLEEVLVNLLENARKYSPAGGPISVTVGGDANVVNVAVRDLGIGIPPADHERIFEPFHRAQNMPPGGSGLGLGLYIAREFVRAHGGTLSVESTPGEGTTFCVTLPRRCID